MAATDYWLKTYPKLTKELLMQKLDAIIDSSFDGLWICDADGRVIRINRASEEINGIEAKQVLGRKMKELVKEGLIDRSVTLEVLKSGTARTMVQNLRNGKQILVTGNPVFGEDGKIILVVTNDRDITQLNKLRADLDESQTLNREYEQRLVNLVDEERLLSDVIVRSEEMQRILITITKVARVDSTVLIHGESGVGKGLFAKLIHAASRRKEGSFVRVDCAAIPEPLFESELFGYESGAFTGARQNGKIGQLELAEEGTLFFDEIGSIPLNTQVKLLRFLENGEIVRIGGTTPKKINARVVAATNKDLGALIRSGKFREDLFFRLNVVPIKIPALRDRKEDIPALVSFYLKKFTAMCGISKTISPAVIHSMCNYDFPGNIRELANLIEQMVVLSPGECIEESDLPVNMRESSMARKSHAKLHNLNLKKATSDMEKQLINESLSVFGSQRKAAIQLGINQSTLARKLKRYGIKSDAK